MAAAFAGAISRGTRSTVSACGPLSCAGWRLLLLLVLVAPMFGAGEARADVLATNLGTLLISQRGDFFHAVEVSDYDWESAPVGIAQKFTTGDHGGGYTLSSVDVCVLDVAALAVPKVTIYTADADGNPGTLKYTLSNPASYNEAGEETAFTSCDDGEKRLHRAV